MFKSVVSVFMASVCFAANAFASISFDVPYPVNPPYTESGFHVVDSTGGSESAVFSTSDNQTISGYSDAGWFGFAGNNEITITSVSGNAFDLESLVFGPSTMGSGTTNVTFTGFLQTDPLSPLMLQLSDLTTAQLVTFNWTNLSSFTILTSMDAGIDNVSAAVVPEPSTYATLAGLGALFLVRRRRS